MPDYIQDILVLSVLTMFSIACVFAIVSILTGGFDFWIVRESASQTFNNWIFVILIPVFVYLRFMMF